MITTTHPDGRLECGSHNMVPLNVTQGDARLYVVQGPGVRWEETFLAPPETARRIIEMIEDAFVSGYECAQRNMRAALGLETDE